MDELKRGDLVTFRLQGERYGLAQIIHVEKLALHNNYHLAIYDAVLDAGPEEIDELGIVHERTHDFDGIEAAPMVIDHIAVTYEAFARSEPVRVGFQEVSGEDLIGYRVWLVNRYNEGVQRGLFRQASEEPEEESFEDVEGEEGEEYDEELVEGTEELAGEEESIEDADDDLDEIPLPPIPEDFVARPWHARLFDIPVGAALFEMHDALAVEPFRDTALGGIIAARFDGSNQEEIDDLVRQFVEGDYGAGHELLNYGDPAADALYRALDLNMSPELADDILRILGDMGSDRAYEHIADFFVRHGLAAGDPLSAPAARGYCYAVMLTGGDPMPLRPHLRKLEAITDPELSDDVASAREAIVSLQVSAPPRTEESAASTDPFAKL